MTTKAVGDTTHLSVSKEDTDAVNHMKIDLDACNELADSMHSEIQNRIKLQAKSDSIISKQETDIKILEETNGAVTELKDVYKSGERKAKRKVKVFKFTSIVLGVVVVVETGWIFLTTQFR